MEASYSSSTLNRHSPHLGQDKDHEHAQIFELGLEDARVDESYIPQSRTSRALRRLQSAHPGFYRKATRLVNYVRGPSPTVELPEPEPWILALRFRDRQYGVPLETRLIRWTSPLTVPWLFALLGAAYIVGLAFFSRAQSFLVPSESFIGCTSTYWSANAGCGLDGLACAPFENSTFDFRCPAQCKSVDLLNPRTVGDEQVVFQPLIVGGGDDLSTYRGDSFICAAALQAGLISNSRGGCGTISLTGNFTNFLPRTANGLSSIGFPTVFPLSYRFSPSSPFSHCSDLRNDALVMNVLVTVILVLLLRPKPVVIFWCLVCIGFWHVTLFSQPRSDPPDLADAFGTFLPALFICYAFWRLAFRFVMPIFVTKMPIEAAILYLGPYWVTVLTNLTFDKIPIDRLTAEDIKAQPGGITALIIIIVVVLVLVVNQARVIRKTGWLPYYVGWYIIGGLVVLSIAFLPTLHLRIHHYIIAMVLIPGTAFPTRVSALIQGFLLGLFLSGAAAYGFDSILQTAAQLRRDATIGTDLPAFLTNATTYNSAVPWQNQTILWSPLPSDESWDGFVLLVDDVERYVGAALNFSFASLQQGIPHFFRLALTDSGDTGDFTKAALLWPNGTWVDPLPGPS
ncbi:hypothetical protein FA95DRAFT_1484745 [Auriscalpium vulgare]|uniref:Uncharacterized protein n=1 Tax=Auriscalpium vulgare TaxID=40419 RepID=A0ACB8S790_9AGAM|nr:hypothetical protein FA95DRAFT_1484745 [Auriscalpium vulgare]